MLRCCQQNNKSVLTKVRSGQLDAVAMSSANFVDDIILAMQKNEILNCLSQGIQDKRADNNSIPFELLLAFATAAKMKLHTSLTDIPFAIQDHRVLAELGYNLIDTEGKLGANLMSESGIRYLLGQYESTELFNDYNKTVQQYIMPKLDIQPNIHILDCTELEVNLKNEHYEQSAVTWSKKGRNTRGYKLSTIRGLTGDTGIIEDIRFGAINVHDLALSEEMLKTSPCLKSGDILIEDRGFISRDVMNYLKTNRGVDTFIPLRKNMDAYNMAVAIAKDNNKWFTHPNKNRTNQKIAFVPYLRTYWQTENPQNDVQLNAAVSWDIETDNYFVFVTTDLNKTAKQIIQTYELRPEIEEDYRQLKDFWKLEDFKSTKINVIAFHIICVLFGYLFFQLYTLLPEGEQYAKKSLPVILKNYEQKTMKFVVLYVENEFAILTLLELLDLYSSCGEEVKCAISKVLKY